MGETNARTNGRLARHGGGGAILVTILVGVVTLWAIQTWDGRESRALAAADLAADLTDEVRLVRSLATEGGPAPATLADARQRAFQTLTALDDLGAGEELDADLRALQRALESFDGAVDAYLGAGNASGHAPRPDPAEVERASLAIQRAAIDAAARADRAADVGSALGFVAAVMIGGLAALRRSRAGEAAAPANEPGSAPSHDLAPAVAGGDAIGGRGSLETLSTR